MLFLDRILAVIFFETLIGGGDFDTVICVCIRSCDIPKFTAFVNALKPFWEGILKTILPGLICIK